MIMTLININIIKMMIKRRVGSTFQTVRESRIPDRQLFLFNFQEEERPLTQPIKQLTQIKSNQIKSLIKGGWEGEEKESRQKLQLNEKYWNAFKSVHS